MKNVATVKKLIMKVGCIVIRKQSEDRIENCFLTYKEGVFPQLD